MKNEFARRVTCNEKLYIAFADCGYDMTFRFLVRVDRMPPAQEMDRALRTAVDNCRYANMCYRRGKWYFSDDLPAFEVVETDLDDIHEHPVATIDCRRRTLALYGIRQRRAGAYYLSFDFFHGTCDAQSALCFIYDVFAALNGRPLPRYLGTVTDLDIAKAHESPCGEAPTVTKKCRLARCPDGTPPRSLINLFSTDFSEGRLAAKLTYSLSRAFLPENALTVISVDARRSANEYGVRLFGNLTLPLFIEGGRRSLPQIAEEIRQKLKRGAHLSRKCAHHPLLKIAPLPWISAVIGLYEAHLRKRKRFGFCGVVSPLGRADVAALENPFFKVLDMDSQIGDALPLCGFVVSAFAFEDRLNVSLSCAKHNIDESTLQALKDAVRASVK